MGVPAPAVMPKQTGPVAPTTRPVDVYLCTSDSAGVTGRAVRELWVNSPTGGIEGRVGRSIQEPPASEKAEALATETATQKPSQGAWGCHALSSL